VPRTISSAQTFVMKLVVPLVWIGGFGFGTAALFRGAARLGHTGVYVTFRCASI